MIELPAVARYLSVRRGQPLGSEELLAGIIKDEHDAVVNECSQYLIVNTKHSY